VHSGIIHKGAHLTTEKYNTVGKKLWMA